VTTFAAPAALTDSLARPLGQIRISVTDRCNFRCTYCMPRAEYAAHEYLPKSALLSFEEIVRVVRVLVPFGVRKVRLTGGEPLLRKQLPRLVEQLAELDVELALTTNGTQLPAQALALRSAGLTRITLSLDTLDEHAFQRLADAPGYRPSDVLHGLEAAERAGFGPVKINCVVRRDLSHLQVEPLVEHFRGSGHVLRFIEYMDVGMKNGWQARDVVSGAEILERIGRLHPIEPLAGGRGEVARRYRLRDGSLEVGIITSITQPFCGDCNRMRLSADGQVFTCLFASRGHDIKALLRQEPSDTLLTQRLAEVWSTRSDRYSELRANPALSTLPPVGTVRQLPVLDRVEMSFIGG
jgi:cyclic pyranopterin phosphate synthase